MIRNERGYNDIYNYRNYFFSYNKQIIYKKNDKITSILSSILKDFKNNLVDPGIIDDLRNKIKV